MKLLSEYTLRLDKHQTYKRLGTFLPCFEKVQTFFAYVEWGFIYASGTPKTIATESVHLAMLEHRLFLSRGTFVAKNIVLARSWFVFLKIRYFPGHNTHFRKMFSRGQNDVRLKMLGYMLAYLLKEKLSFVPPDSLNAGGAIAIL